MFAESGYDGATVRTIARRAGVDPAMVNHWFGGKDGLFVKAVLRVPFDADELVETVTADGPGAIGANLVRAFVTRWDDVGGGQFAAVIRSITTHEQSLATLKNVLIENLFGVLTSAVTTDRPELRANLAATQVIGLGMARYVAKLEPLASADVETLVAAVAPNIQRYLTGDLGTV